MDDEEAFLSIEYVTKKFGAFTALDAVSLELRAGELVCLLGPSGCGKSTLLRCIAGLHRQDEGRIFLANREIGQLPAQQRDYGMLFQSYALFPNLTVEQNVAYGLSQRRRLAPVVHKRVREMLDLVGLGHLAQRYPSQLSGGQQQRVALARALAPSPSLLLLDEPMSALDARIREQLRIDLRNLQRKLGITTLMVTHDQEEAMMMADRIAVMDQGKIQQFARPQDLYRQPANTFVADFIGDSNCLFYERLDTYVAQVGELQVHTAMPLLQPNGRLYVRPEQVQLAPVGESRRPALQKNWFVAHFIDGIFLGRYYKLFFQLERADQTQIEVLLPAAQAEPYMQGLGKKYWLHLPSEALAVYKEVA